MGLYFVFLVHATIMSIIFMLLLNFILNKTYNPHVYKLMAYSQ
jgi:hypothetical protein